MLHQFYPQVFHSYSYELNKDMQISAAHYIPHEKAGKCARVHGHTYFVNLTICGDQLDDSGFLVNFQHLKKWVHDRFDIRCSMTIRMYSMVKTAKTFQRQKWLRGKFGKLSRII